MERGSWVIFDADNTLWSIEHLYDDARRELCQFLNARGISAAAAENFQQHRDHELYATYGYSACRFARSFEDTLLQFLPSAPAVDVRHARQLALNVFERRATPVTGLEDLLRTLKPHYFFGVITAGERWVQERRLSDFHLRQMFAAIDIVEAKTPEVFSSFCRRHGVERSTSWVVGDSLNSDILPAVAAGLRAVLVQSSNWARVEGQLSEPRAGFVAVGSLTDLPTVPGMLPA